MKLFPTTVNEIKPLWKQIISTTYTKFYSNYTNVRSINDKKDEANKQKLFAGMMLASNSVYSYV